MITIGSVSLGLVWGWHLYLLGGASWQQRPFFTVLLLTPATVLAILQIWWFQAPVLPFLLALGLTFILHHAWQHSLRQKSPDNP